MRTALPLLLAVACNPGTGNDPDRPAESCSDPDNTQASVISMLRFAREVDGVSHGFDLDGEQSVEEGGDGCGIEDYTNHQGEGGVDNALARIIPALELTEAIAAEDLVQQVINTGELLLMFELSGVDDPANDECIDFSMVRGIGAPDVGTHGFINDGQTFDRDPEVPASDAYGVSLSDGVVEAHGLYLEIPLQIFQADFVAILEEASVHIEYNPDGSFSGYVGGSFDPQIIIDVANNNPVDATLAASLPYLFEQNSDLDSADGACTRMSMTLEFEGVNAYFYDEEAEFAD